MKNGYLFQKKSFYIVKLALEHSGIFPINKGINAKLPNILHYPFHHMSAICESLWRRHGLQKLKFAFPQWWLMRSWKT